MAVQLREYRPADFESLWALDQVCFPAEIAYSRPELRMFLSLRSAFCIVAETGAELAGFTVVDARPRRAGYIVTIDVAPPFRRGGVATALLHAVEERLAAQGSPAIRLEVADNNTAAIAFYRRHGFRAIGRKRGYYNGTLDAISMRKELRAL